jgi:cobalt-zinc-cadmium efflux system outer membrane protein
MTHAILESRRSPAAFMEDGMGTRTNCRRVIALAALVGILEAQADDGLRLEDYVRIVLQSHPATQAARALDESASAETKAARLLPDPTLELSLGEGRAADGTGSPKTEKGFSISQVIPWLPARSASIEAADHEARALRAEGQATRWGIELDARLAYFRLLFAQAQVEVDRAAEEDARSLLDLMTRRASLGEAREVDRIKARVEWLRQDRELSAAHREETASEAILRTLARDPLPESLRLSGALPRHTDAMRALLDAKPDRLEMSPVLTRASAEAARAASLLSSARRGRVPDLGFSFFRQKELDREAWGGSLGVVVPLWNARRGDVARAEAESRLRAADAEGVRLSLLADLATRRRDVETLAVQVASLEGDLLPSAAESVRLARLLFEEGETSLLDLLDAQRTAREARREEIRARFDLASAIAELQRLLGPTDTPSGR